MGMKNRLDLLRSEYAQFVFFLLLDKCEKYYLGKLQCSGSYLLLNIVLRSKIVTSL